MDAIRSCHLLRLVLAGGDGCNAGRISVIDIVALDVGAFAFPPDIVQLSQHGGDIPEVDSAPPDRVRTVQAAQVGPPVEFTCINVVTCRIGRQGAGDAYLTARA
ncbi:hypothetical protein ES708_15261 [subsurface metagenome]